MTPPPAWSNLAYQAATTVLAPFVSPVLPDGPEADVALRGHVRREARGDDGRPFPLVLGSRTYAGVRELLDRGENAVEPEVMDDDRPSWTPRLVPDVNEIREAG